MYKSLSDYSITLNSLIAGSLTGKCGIQLVFSLATRQQTRAAIDL